jgi:hypothetical protein
MLRKQRIEIAGFIISSIEEQSKEWFIATGCVWSDKEE